MLIKIKDQDNADKDGSSWDKAPWGGSNCSQTMVKIPKKRGNE